MQKSFWKILKENSEKKPIIGLSPMDGVTDHPYRYIQKKHGNPSVTYTEFVSVEGLCHNAITLLKDFIYDDTQRPIVAQIYGTTPNYFRQIAVLLCELGFDGIDINMGCPAKNVAHSGAGSALIKTPILAQEIIMETKAGVQDWLNGMKTIDCTDISPRISKEISRMRDVLIDEGSFMKSREDSTIESIPVSVKTRIGYDKKVVSEWIPVLLETNPAVIAIHGRTLKQAYGGEADWDEIARAITFVSGRNSTLIFGNGDIKSYENAVKKINKYGVDGVLIGRASFGNPFVFLPEKKDEESILINKKLTVALKHSRLYEKTYKEFEGFAKKCGIKYNYNFLPMRKHLGWYVRGMLGAKEIRMKLFQSNSSDEVKKIFEDYGYEF